jgi:hypothetical protein
MAYATAHYDDVFGRYLGLVPVVVMLDQVLALIFSVSASFISPGASD